MVKYLLFFSLLFTPDLYQAREHLNNNEIDKAVVVLESLDETDPEVMFYLAYAYEKDLQMEKAVEYYKLFLDSDCEKERLVIAAYRRVMTIQSMKSNKYFQISRKMGHITQRLLIKDTGKETQKRQEEVLFQIESLIAEAKSSEADAAAQKIKNAQEKQAKQTKQGSKQENKAAKSKNKSEKGGESNQPNYKAVVKNYQQDAQPWNKIRDRARDPVNSAYKDKLPPKYKKIVENYYKRTQELEEWR